MILSLGSAALYEYSFIPHHSRDVRKQYVKSIFPVVTDEEAVDLFALRLWLADGGVSKTF